MLFVPELREDASRGAPTAVKCLLFRSQAGSLGRGGRGHVPGCPGTLPERAWPRGPARSRGGRTSFSAQKQREPSRRRQPTPPIRGSGSLIVYIRGDVVRFTDSTPSARRAGGIVFHPALFRRLLTWPWVRPGGAIRSGCQPPPPPPPWCPRSLW